jgi:hypothetical protein
MAIIKERREPKKRRRFTVAISEKVKLKPSKGKRKERMLKSVEI